MLYGLFGGKISCQERFMKKSYTLLFDYKKIMSWESRALKNVVYIRKKVKKNIETWFFFNLWKVHRYWKSDNTYSLLLFCFTLFQKNILCRKDLFQVYLF